MIIRASEQIILIRETQDHQSQASICWPVVHTLDQWCVLQYKAAGPDGTPSHVQYNWLKSTCT